MWPFRPARELAADQRWQLATMRWLIRTVTTPPWAGVGLHLPSAEEFPSGDLRGHALATHLFDLVRRKNGMMDWPVELQPQHGAEDDAALPFGIPSATSSKGAVGTFQLIKDDGGQVVARVTYDPGSLATPVDFLTTMAHELAHYLLAAQREEIPGGEALHEHATDMTAIFMGWGVFILRSSSRFEQYSSGGMQGHLAKRQGYLSPGECAFGLGLFLEMKKLDHARLAKALSPYHFSLLRKSIGLIRDSRCLESADADG